MQDGYGWGCLMIAMHHLKVYYTHRHTTHSDEAQSTLRGGLVLLLLLAVSQSGVLVFRNLSLKERRRLESRAFVEGRLGLSGR